MEPSLKQLRYFIAAADSGQISKAANNIFVSQSAITTAIKTLEEITGTTLFERHSGGVKLTYEGNLFLENARHILHSVEEAINMPRQIREDIQGQLNLGVTYTVAGYFLPNILSKFSRSFPNVTINITEADRNTIEESLITSGFDLALMLTSNLVNQEDISHKVLLKSQRHLWLGSNHPFLERQSVSLQEISKEPYIMLTVDEASNTAQRYWNRTAYQPNTIFRTSSVEAVRSMVANGTGVSILSDMVYRPWSLEGRRIELMDVSDPIPTMDVGLAWKSTSARTHPMKAFIDYLQLSATNDSLSR